MKAVCTRSQREKGWDVCLVFAMPSEEEAKVSPSSQGFYNSILGRRKKKVELKYHHNAK